jgi:hypothetical protein
MVCFFDRVVYGLDPFFRKAIGICQPSLQCSDSAGCSVSFVDYRRHQQFTGITIYSGQPGTSRLIEFTG